ncbi:hypothetical protein EDB85DRAFT_2276269 [Lactarius pseudohatsudake]|nr:hypothetical protein EDB85DRAFT_2276269 [Lactarius pseudohatsudake]
MAAAQDLEYGEMVSNSTRIAESQGSLSRVEVTVLRAHNLPSIKKRRGLKRSFYVTITHDTTTKKTKSGRIDGPTVHWNQPLGIFSTQRSSHLILRLYEKRRFHADVVIGTHKITIPVETQTEVPYVLTNHDEQSGQSNQQVTLYLKVVVSPAENALRDADGAMTSINLSNKWEGALVRIKWVVDTLGPVAEVRHDVLFFADP